MGSSRIRRGLIRKGNFRVLRESGCIVKKIKDFSDLASSCLGLLLKVSTPLGGAVLLIYAAKEGFFYDTSSIAAISVLVFVLSAFVALTLFMLLYGAVMSIWFIALVLWLARRRPKGTVCPATNTIFGWAASVTILAGKRLLMPRPTIAGPLGVAAKTTSKSPTYGTVDRM
jgi:hypothetical protein